MERNFELIRKLPRETQVWCGHEYTVANLVFAKSVEPCNRFVDEKLDWAQKERSALRLTVPSTLEEEFRYNPFLRRDVGEVKVAVGQATDDNVTTLQLLREKKNNFRS